MAQRGVAWRGTRGRGARRGAQGGDAYALCAPVAFALASPRDSRASALTGRVQMSSAGGAGAAGGAAMDAAQGGADQHNPAKILSMRAVASNLEVVNFW